MTDEPTTYVDLCGLSRTAEDIDAYVLALGLPAEPSLMDPPCPITIQEHRLNILAMLRGSAGITVYTGPFGAAFWMLASPEINVRIVPDGTDYSERTTDVAEWSFRAAGATPTLATALMKRDKPPTTRAKDYPLWVRAAELQAEMSVLIGKNPRIRIMAPASVQVLYEPAEQFALLQRIKDSDVFTAEDWEWKKDAADHDPVGLAVSNATENWYLPVQGSNYPYNKQHAEALRRVWAERLTYGPPVVLHDGRADLSKQYPGDPLHLSGRPIDDTLVLAYNAGDTELKLKLLTRARLGRDPMDYPGELADMPVELASRYAAAGDSRNTYDLFLNLKEAVEERGQTLVYEEMERPLMPIIASMQKYGVPIDHVRLDELRVNFGAMAEGLRSLMWARHHRDISSKSEIRALVKDMTGYDPGSVNKDVLSKTTDVWMDSILGYRRIMHRKTAFLDMHYNRWVAAGEPADFRGYVYFNQAGAPDPDDPRGFKVAPRSGRLSSSGEFGNFMNQPVDIRDIFTAPKGCNWWKFDYKGLELHIAAAMTQDPVMLEALRAGTDIHGDFQSRIQRMTGVDVGRVAAKGGVFATQYGGGPDAVMLSLNRQRAHISYDTAKMIVELHHVTYPVYHNAAAAVEDTARENGGWAYTLYGRARQDLDLFSHDRKLQGHAARALFNHTIQGTAADILKMAMAWSVPTLLKYDAHLALQIHDELCGWVPKETTRPFIAAMRVLMESIELPGLRLTVTGGAGANWSEVH